MTQFGICIFREIGVDEVAFIVMQLRPLMFDGCKPVHLLSGFKQHSVVSIPHSASAQDSEGWMGADRSLETQGVTSLI